MFCTTWLKKCNTEDTKQSKWKYPRRTQHICKAGPGWSLSTLALRTEMKCVRGLDESSCHRCDRSGRTQPFPRCRRFRDATVHIPMRQRQERTSRRNKTERDKRNDNSNNVDNNEAAEGTSAKRGKRVVCLRKTSRGPDSESNRLPSQRVNGFQEALGCDQR